MVETIINYISTIPTPLMAIAIFLIAFVENVFPPSPSDALILFSGTLVPSGNVDFVLLWIFATLGSLAGFLTMFAVGVSFDKKVIEQGKLKYIKYETVMKVEKWFQKWGYSLIVINRFLSGTRGVISFFAGMSLLKVRTTTILSAISAAIWNFILLYLGLTFSNNWQEINKQIEKYGTFIFYAVLFLITIFIIYTLLKKKKTADEK
jgi:membrane protein DedA with SNARE-associated domain